MPVKEIIKNRDKQSERWRTIKQVVKRLTLPVKELLKTEKKKKKKLPTKTIGQNTSKCFWNNETTLAQQKNYQLGQIT